MNQQKQANSERPTRNRPWMAWLAAIENRMPGSIIRLGGYIQESGISALILMVVISGGLTGLVLVSLSSLTSFAREVDALADYRPPEITKVYASNGRVIGELSLERRIPIEYSQIPERLKQALLAIEDTRFYEHLGIDPVRIAGSLVQNFVQQRRAQGASTLTQQLARTLFLNREKTYIRKIKEVMFALQIERVYTKEQILTMYCNQHFLGGGAYGFEAASGYYFRKPLKDLGLHQYALLAALPKAPQQYSPLLRPKAALERRNLVLQAMADAGFITEAEAVAARAKPLDLDPDDQRGRNDRTPHAYFIEEVRQELQRLLVEKHSQDAMDVYRAGLSVYTSLDEEAQIAAVKAVRKGAQQYQRRHGWKIKLENIGARDQASLDRYSHPSWTRTAPAIDEVMTGLIREVGERGAQVSFGSYAATVTSEQTQIVGRPPGSIFKRGDLAPFRIRSIDAARKRVEVTFEPQPDVQAALVLLDVRSGQIKALVGGYDFAITKFNHATQANRQTGSVFKPFIYAAAIEQGLRIDDYVDDQPFQRGEWIPHNYDDSYMGPISIRQALALSRNIPAVRILDEIGVNNAANLVTRLKLPNPMAPFLPSALGATEEPLLSMAAAYAVFANRGQWSEPTRIVRVVDRDGNILDSGPPRQEQVITPYVAGQVVELMKGVVQSGTAGAASSLGHELAGKTGTVNDFTDAWFIGYTPTVVCGVWIGYSDQKKSLGAGESGASAALPFWIDFMREYLKDKPREKFPDPPELTDEMRVAQGNRSRIHAIERARLGVLSGEILPESSDLELDPLGNSPSGDPVRSEPQPVRPPTTPNATQDTRGSVPNYDRGDRRDREPGPRCRICVVPVIAMRVTCKARH
ncbi:MAG: PBP1A family penicillin-binding protein [Acidobacteria bacterium]|nr:PBP1A family penicillin-binding protein [Acidobacteriota bacterium]